MKKDGQIIQFPGTAEKENSSRTLDLQTEKILDEIFGDDLYSEEELKALYDEYNDDEYDDDEYDDDEYDDDLIEFDMGDKQEIDILIVVDMQNDFIDGALGTKEAEAIVPKVADRIKNFEGLVLFTADTHDEDYLETPEGKKLPVKHCIKGTKGWELNPQIQELLPSPEYLIEKPVFGSVDLVLNMAMLSEDKEVSIRSITLIGLCTDICVVSNAIMLKNFLPEVPIIVDASCCAGVTLELHDATLKVMQSCQIDVI